MMVLFRSSFITATLVCVAIVGQFATVHAAPQFGMRPKLHVLGADGSGSEFDSLVSATATVDVSASSVVLSAEITAPTAKTSQPPDSISSDDTGTELSAQTNAAASSASGFGVALLIGSAVALIQIL